jgi:tripartite-type tricarboxylate transporter receptor subunit TctC
MYAIRLVTCAASLAGALALAVPAVQAQDYPTKPIRFVIPFAPGGSVDLVARVVANGLSERLGRQVQPDNRPGAGGTLGTEMVANAPADGYTLLQMSLAHAVNPSVYTKLNYDSIKSFAPIHSLGSGPSVLTVHPSVPVSSVKELIAMAKAKPGELNVAHAGIASFTHTAGVLFAMMAGIDVVQVPFKGGGPAMIDVIGGHSQVLINSYVASTPHVRSGKLKALGVTDLKRTPLLPNVPTIDEAGVPGYSAANWWGIAAPAGTPQPIIDKLAKEIAAVLASPETQKQFAADGVDTVMRGPAEFGQFIESEIAKWGRVVKEAKLKLE